MKIVYVTRVYSRSMFADMGATIKNLWGGRIKIYEIMITTMISLIMMMNTYLFVKVASVVYCRGVS